MELFSFLVALGMPITRHRMMIKRKDPGGRGSIPAEVLLQGLEKHPVSVPDAKTGAHDNKAGHYHYPAMLELLFFDRLHNFLLFRRPFHPLVTVPIGRFPVEKPGIFSGGHRKISLVSQRK